MTLHILVNARKELLIGTFKDHGTKDDAGALKSWIKHRTEEQGEPLLRIVIINGEGRVVPPGEV